MLSKKEKILLKEITNNHSVGDDIDTSELKSRVNLTEYEINSICDSFNKEGLFSDYCIYANGTIHFTVSHRAFLYREQQQNELLKYITTSIIVPIIVGVLSSILSTIIINLMS